MNNIRGFSVRVPPDAALFREARNGAEDVPRPEKGANSFETVLTGLSQSSGDAEAAAKPAQPSAPWSMLSKEQGGTPAGGADGFLPEQALPLGESGPAATGDSSPGLPEQEPETQGAHLASSAIELGLGQAATLPASVAIESSAKLGSSPNQSLVRGNASAQSTGPFARGDLATGSLSQNREQESSSVSTQASAAAVAPPNTPILAALSAAHANDRRRTLKLESDGALSDAAAVARRAPAVPLGSNPTQGPVNHETATSTAGASQNKFASASSPEAVVRSKASPANSDFIVATGTQAQTKAATAQAQTGEIGRADISRRDRDVRRALPSDGKAQRPRRTDNAAQIPTAGANAVAPPLTALPPSLDPAASASASNDVAPVRMSETAGRSPVAKGADQLVDMPEEDMRATQNSIQGGFGSSFEVKANVVSASAHFAPVTRLSPVQQIAGFVATSLPSLAGGSPGTPGADASTPPVSFDPVLAVAQPAAGAVKTLDLQLEPDSLGQVTIRLNLSDAGLDLEIQASHGATVDLIEKGKQSLADQLRQSGYSVAGLEIRLAGAVPSHLSTDGSGADQATSGDGQATGGSMSGDGSAHDSSARAQRPQSSASPQDANGSAVRRSARGDLYV
jgi:chemotaxis protein MotD